MHGSRSKIPTKKSRPYLYGVKFLALLGAPYVCMYVYIYIYIYDISRLRVKHKYQAAITIVRMVTVISYAHYLKTGPESLFLLVTTAVFLILFKICILIANCIGLRL
jgi:hypothetical protein